MQEIKDFIARHRFPLTDETQTQGEIENALIAAGMAFAREVRLSVSDRVDFMIGKTAVEIKLKGSPMKIYRQLARYAEHEDVEAILLVTARTMTLPATINGKPAAVVSLGRAWL